MKTYSVKWFIGSTGHTGQKVADFDYGLKDEYKSKDIYNVIKSLTPILCKIALNNHIWDSFGYDIKLLSEKKVVVWFYGHCHSYTNAIEIREI